jgi:hypothetical protein
LDCESLTLVNAMSGRHVVIAQISSPTPDLYLICILVARSCCALDSEGPIAELNFFIQLGSVGSGVGQFLVMGTLESHVSSYFKQNFLMYEWMLVLP